MLALRAARVFDGSTLAAHPVVLVDNDVIVDVGVNPPADAEIVDLGDTTLVPGFVDTHQHLVFTCAGTLEEMVTGVTEAELVDRARTNAATALAAGVTTIRDLGDRDYVTLGLRDDASLPTLHCAGPPITVVNGHCWYLGGACEPADLPQTVAARAERGCDVVKVMVSGGVLTPTFPTHFSQFDTAELRVIVDEAHRLGLPVAAHCHGIAAIESSLAVGVDSIEHCTFAGEDGDAHPSDDLIDRLAAARIPVSATLGALPGLPRPPVVERNFDLILGAWRKIADRGGVVVTGSDAGVGMAKPHDVLPHAFDDLVRAGWSRSDAIGAMTAEAARVIGLGHRKGRIAAGYDADLVAIAGDPVTGADDLHTVVGVWLRGIPAIAGGRIPPNMV